MASEDDLDRNEDDRPKDDEQTQAAQEPSAERPSDDGFNAPWEKPKGTEAQSEQDDLTPIGEELGDDGEVSPEDLLNDDGRDSATGFGELPRLVPIQELVREAPPAYPRLEQIGSEIADSIDRGEALIYGEAYVQDCAISALNKLFEGLSDEEKEATYVLPLDATAGLLRYDSKKLQMALARCERSSEWLSREIVIWLNPSLKSNAGFLKSLLSEGRWDSLINAVDRLGVGLLFSLDQQGTELGRDLERFTEEKEALAIPFEELFQSRWTDRNGLDKNGTKALLEALREKLSSVSNPRERAIAIAKMAKLSPGLEGVDGSNDIERIQTVIGGVEIADYTKWFGRSVELIEDPDPGRAKLFRALFGLWICTGKLLSYDAFVRMIGHLVRDGGTIQTSQVVSTETVTFSNSRDLSSVREVESRTYAPVSVREHWARNADQVLRDFGLRPKLIAGGHFRIEEDPQVWPIGIPGPELQERYPSLIRNIFDAVFHLDPHQNPIYRRDRLLSDASVAVVAFASSLSPETFSSAKIAEWAAYSLSRIEIDQEGHFVRALYQLASALPPDQDKDYPAEFIDTLTERIHQTVLSRNAHPKLVSVLAKTLERLLVEKNFPVLENLTKLLEGQPRVWPLVLKSFRELLSTSSNTREDKRGDTLVHLYEKCLTDAPNRVFSFDVRQHARILLGTTLWIETLGEDFYTPVQDYFQPEQTKVRESERETSSFYEFLNDPDDAEAVEARWQEYLTMIAKIDWSVIFATKSLQDVSDMLARIVAFDLSGSLGHSSIPSHEQIVGDLSKFFLNHIAERWQAIAKLRSEFVEEIQHVGPAEALRRWSRSVETSAEAAEIQKSAAMIPSILICLMIYQWISVSAGWEASENEELKSSEREKIEGMLSIVANSMPDMEVEFQEAIELLIESLDRMRKSFDSDAATKAEAEIERRYLRGLQSRLRRSKGIKKLLHARYKEMSGETVGKANE